MFSDWRSDDQNRVVEGGEGVPVALDTLDNILAPGGEIDLLKIDVEGYELFALQGAEETLARTACVYFESCESNFRKYDYGTGEVPGHLMDRGFSVLRLEGGMRVVPVGRDYISGKCENLIAAKSVDDLAGWIGYKLGGGFPPDRPRRAVRGM